MNRQTMKQTHKQMKRHTNTQTDEETNTQTDKETNKHTNRWRDKQTNRQMEGHCHHIKSPYLRSWLNNQLWKVILILVSPVKTRSRASKVILPSAMMQPSSYLVPTRPSLQRAELQGTLPAATASRWRRPRRWRVTLTVALMQLCCCLTVPQRARGPHCRIGVRQRSCLDLALQQYC